MRDFFKAMWQNIKDLPRDIKLIFNTPARARNLLWRFTESVIGIGAFVLAQYGGYSLLLSILFAFLVEFVAFEYLGEPAGLTGYYFERGPREHEGEWPNTGWWEE